MSDARTLAYRRRRERTTEAVLDAAVEIFRERGFEAATVEEIAARAGVSRAALYLRFDSKSAVMIATLDRAFEGQDALSEDYRAGVAAGRSREQMRDVVVAHILEQEYPVRALHVAVMADPAVGDWYFRTQERALEILLDATDTRDEADVARLRARFHILGRMTLDAMSGSPPGTQHVDAGEVAAYIADLWSDLLDALLRGE